MIWCLLRSSGRRIFSLPGAYPDVKKEFFLRQFPLRPKGQDQVPPHLKVKYWTIHTGNDESLSAQWSVTFQTLKLAFLRARKRGEREETFIWMKFEVLIISMGWNVYSENKVLCMKQMVRKRNSSQGFNKKQNLGYLVSRVMFVEPWLMKWPWELWQSPNALQWMNCNFP